MTSPSSGDGVQVDVPVAPQSILTLLTPCCNAPITVETEWRGHGYGSYEVPAGFSCSGSLCFNEWDREGNLIHATYAPEE